jgi:hypothetical protein
LALVEKEKRLVKLKAQEVLTGKPKDKETPLDSAPSGFDGSAVSSILCEGASKAPTKSKGKDASDTGGRRTKALTKSNIAELIADGDDLVESTGGGIEKINPEWIMWGHSQKPQMAGVFALVT